MDFHNHKKITYSPFNVIKYAVSAYHNTDAKTHLYMVSSS